RPSGFSPEPRSHASTSKSFLSARIVCSEALGLRLLTGGQARFRRFLDGSIALPAFVLQLDVLDGDSVGVGIEIRQGLILGNPASEDLVTNGKLPGFVVEID